MAHELKLIADGLAKEPFRKTVSILDLDSLDGDSAIRFLNDVFAALDPSKLRDLKAESAQDTAARFLAFLRLIRFPSPDNLEDKSVWRQDLVEGRRKAVLPVLLWVVQHVEAIKQRLYLAKYIMKIEVPAELRADPEINRLLEENDRVVADFTAAHKQYIQLKSTGDEVSRIRNEIRDLRAQKEQAERRVEDLAAKVRAVPARNDEKESRMAMSRTLREERDKSTQLNEKRVELLRLAPLQDEKIRQLHEYTRKITDDWLDMSPDILLSRLEDRLSIQRRAVKEVLPRALQQERLVVEDIRHILAQSDFTEKSLNELRTKAQMLQTEVFNASDNIKVAAEEPPDSRLTFLRSQSESLEKRKRELALRNDALYKEVKDLEGHVRDKVQSSGNLTAEGMDFASLSATAMRNKEEYEKKQKILEALDVERRHMLRTAAILSTENERTDDVLSEWVKRTGIPIESSKQQDKSQLGRHTDVNALANDVREQEKDIAKRRKEISARLDELQPIRIRHKDRQETVLAAQQKLDREMKTFSGDLENMEKKNDELGKEVNNLEQISSTLQHEADRLDNLLKRAIEAKTDDSFQRTLQKAIVEETTKLSSLQARTADIKITYGEKSHQASVWNNLDKLFDMKLDHVRADLENMERNRYEFAAGGDRIVM